MRWPRWQSATLKAAPLMVTTGTGSLMQNPMLRVALSANSCCLISFSSRHQNGVNFVFCDGSVRFVSDAISQDIRKAIGTREGGEPINLIQ